MEITRRTALLGAAGGLIGGLPSVALSAPVHPLSPLLPIVRGQGANLLRMNRIDDLGSLALSQHWAYQICPVEFGRSVRSVFEAEDILLASVPAIEHDLTVGPILYSFINDGIRPALLLNRQSNLIAMRTRRAAGNRAFMHPETANHIIKIQTSTSAISVREEALFQLHTPTDGRWMNIGTMNNSVTLYTSPHMTEFEVVIMYRGEADEDAGAVLLDRDNGLTLIDDAKRPDIVTSSAANYMSRVRFRPMQDFVFPPSSAGRGSKVERLPT